MIFFKKKTTKQMEREAERLQKKIDKEQTAKNARMKYIQAKDKLKKLKRENSMLGRWFDSAKRNYSKTKFIRSGAKVVMKGLDNFGKNMNGLDNFGKNCAKYNHDPLNNNPFDRMYKK